MAVERKGSRKLSEAFSCLALLFLLQPFVSSVGVKLFGKGGGFSGKNNRVGQYFTYSVRALIYTILYWLQCKNND